MITFANLPGVETEKVSKEMGACPVLQQPKVRLVEPHWKQAAAKYRIWKRSPSPFPRQAHV